MFNRPKFAQCLIGNPKNRSRKKIFKFYARICRKTFGKISNEFSSLGEKKEMFKSAKLEINFDSLSLERAAEKLSTWELKVSMKNVVKQQLTSRDLIIDSLQN